jgi:hypothetical protein
VAAVSLKRCLLQVTLSPNHHSAAGKPQGLAATAERPLVGNVVYLPVAASRM